VRQLRSQAVLYKKRIGNYIIECTQNGIDENITRFVSDIYYHKPHYDFSDDLNEVYNILLKEDESYKEYSTVINVYDSNNEIQGTIRKIRANSSIKLPTEREFNINLASIVKENLPIHNIYEVARFANRNNNTKALIILLSELVSSGNRNDLFLASLDSKVLNDIRKIGFDWYDAGEPKKYLGSTTCPVALSVSKIDGKFSYGHLYNEFSRKTDSFINIGA
jgi:hypothetical protein